MSDLFSWIEFVQPVYVGEAGYIDKLYLTANPKNPDRAAVCDQYEIRDSQFVFAFAGGDNVSVPFSNVRYTYSAKQLAVPDVPELKRMTFYEAATAAREAPKMPEEVSREAAPRKRGRPAKVKFTLGPDSE